MTRDVLFRMTATLTLLCFLMACSVHQALCPPSPRDIRVLDVKLAATLEFKSSKAWRVEFCKMIRDINLGLKSRLGIAFRVKEIDFWTAQSHGLTLPEYLNDLTRKVPPGECHLVIGILPSWVSQGPPFGAADYLHAYIVVKDHPSKSGLAGVLEHEICHIFGAIDLDEDGSIMGLGGRGSRYDAFTLGVMMLNRDRGFRSDAFPLPPTVMSEVIALYQERLGREENRGESRTIERAELRLVLSRLYREKSGITAQKE